MQPDLRHDLIRLQGVPTLLMLAATGLLHVSHADQWLADTIYAAGGQAWVWRRAWITNDLIHDGGRTLVGVLALGVLGAWLLSFVHPHGQRWRSPSLYLLCTALLAVALVNILKEVTQVDCPWDLVRYGGENLPTAFFAEAPSGQEPGRCYPAGHASAGYCWIGLYFLARQFRPRLRLPALLAPLGLGLVFGVAQQLRGAHFLSHDLMTLYLCWMTASLLYLTGFRARWQQSAG